MITNYSKEGRILTLKITEEIDQHTADQIRRKVDDEITRYSPEQVILDFKDMSFMDSSGIGMVLGRYKLVKLLGGKFKIINVSKRMQKIFDMSGVSRIVEVETEDKVENINAEENKKVI